MTVEDRPMRVRVTLTVEIDAAAYRDAYGPATAADIREHVRSAVQSAAATPGIIAPEPIIRDVTVREDR